VEPKSLGVIGPQSAAASALWEAVRRLWNRNLWVRGRFDGEANLEKRMRKLETVMDQQERKRAQSNILIRGIPEKMTRVDIWELFAPQKGLPNVQRYIRSIMRRGPESLAVKEPRMVVVGFANPFARQAALRYAPHLKPYRFRQYLSIEQRMLRWELKSETTALWNQGYMPFWINDQIHVRLASGALHVHVPGTTPPEPPAPRRVKAGAPHVGKERLGADGARDVEALEAGSQTSLETHVTTAPGVEAPNVAAEPTSLKDVGRESLDSEFSR
jgi:hypothetical protein